MIVPNKLVRTPERSVQENDHGRNEHREEEVEPGAGGKESDEGDEGERDDCDGEVVAGEVEEVPGGGEEEEEEEGEGVALGGDAIKHKGSKSKRGVDAAPLARVP